jgi:peptidoglycan/LPS O-acetylase OafA/YrhL
MQYRSDIDGLRAVAVAPVVLFHAHIWGVSGGFVGVDVFFVISGFLISKVIVSELARGEFSIVRFYERRCRRILPALFAMFLVTSIIGGVVLMPPDTTAFGSSLLSSLLFVSNMYFWKDSGYFDGSAEFKPLLHTWSLSVEEQFYLFVPYLLIAISVFFRKRYFALLAPLALISFGLSIWAVSHAPNAAFYMLPTRFWELLLGGLLAVAASTGPATRWSRDVLAGLGLVLILGAVALYSDETPFPGATALAPCVGAALIIYAGMGGTSYVSSLLSTRPFTFLGKISYSLYLWHWPLFALYRYRVARELTGVESAALVLVALVLATASFQFVEKPFRVPERPLGRRAIFRGAAWGAIATAAIAGTAVATEGLPFRFPRFQMVQALGQSHYDAGKHDDCFLADPQTYEDWGGEGCFVTRHRGPNVLLWGDSFAAHYVPGIKAHAEQMRADILEYTLSACPPVLGFDTLSVHACRAFNDHVLKVVEQYDIKGVIVSGRWDYAFKRHVEPDQINASLSRLRALGVAVFVIGQSPMFGNHVQTLFAQAGGTGDQPEGWGHVVFGSDINGKLASAVPSGIRFIDPLELMCTLPTCPYRHEGTFMMWDQGHFSEYGSALAVETYFPYYAGH